MLLILPIQHCTELLIKVLILRPLRQRWSHLDACLNKKYNYPIQVLIMRPLTRRRWPPFFLPFFFSF